MVKVSRFDRDNEGSNPSSPAIRSAARVLRRWCPIALLHQPADEPWCMSADEHRDHRLRLRRMFVCSRCEQGYFTQEMFDAHECYSAY